MTEMSARELTWKLFQAARRGDVKKVRSLLKSGAENEPSNTKKSTPMIEAAKGGHTECVKALLSHGNIWEKDLAGLTALMWAAKEGRTECVRLLISKKSCITQQLGDKWETATTLAIQNGHMDCVSIILDALVEKPEKRRDEAIKVLREAARMKYDESHKSLLKYVEVDAVDDKGHSGIFQAAFHGNEPALRMMLPLAPNPNVICNGTTLLTIAARNGFDDCLRATLSAGADVNAPDGDGWTALSWAAHNDHAECARILLTNGADPNGQGGESPVEIARRRGNEEVAQAIEAYLKARDERDVLNQTAGKGAGVGRRKI